MISLIAASLTAAQPAAAPPAPPVADHARPAQHQQAAPHGANPPAQARMEGCCCCKDMAGKMHSGHGAGAKADPQDHSGH